MLFTTSVMKKARRSKPRQVTGKKAAGISKARHMSASYTLGRILAEFTILGNWERPKPNVEQGSFGGRTNVYTSMIYSLQYMTPMRDND